MKKENNCKSLLEAIKNRMPLIMCLGDDVYLHMVWNKDKQLYEDEMGTTSFKLIQQIINGMVNVDGYLVNICEDKND